MRTRRKSTEVLLSRPVARPLAKRRDGPLYPQIMPDIPGMTVKKFWESIEAQKKRKTVRVRRPRLLDPVERPQSFGEAASEELALAARADTRRSRNPNRAGTASTFRLLARPGVDLAVTDYQSRQQSGPCPGISKQQAAQPVKPKKPMIILGQIQQVTEQTMTDKKDATKVSRMFLVVIADKTKPAQFRTSTPFCTFLTEEKFRGQFGADAQAAVDEPVTLAVHEIAPYNAFMKVKGQVMKGHLTAEHLLALQNGQDGKQPQKPGK